MFLVLYVILLVAFLVAVLIFGDSPALRNTPLQKLHRVLLRWNGKVVHFITASPSVYASIRWLVPLFYCAIIGVCVWQFFSHVYGRLEIRHSVGHTIYIFFTLASLVLSTELLTFSDPGFASSASVNNALDTYKANGLIFFADKSCRTCHLPKPARSKHCSTCGRCVYLYDHHCIFVNNCVGQNNYRWFLAFLFANVNLMVYGGSLCWAFLRNDMATYGWWSAITRTSDANRIAGTLLILAGIFASVVAAFTALHVRYIYLGVTTNEADKWGEIEHLVSLGVLYHVADTGNYAERASYASENGDTEPEIYISLDEQRVLFSEGEPHGHHLSKVSSVATDLDNIYDQGFWRNVESRLTPPWWA